MDQEGTSKVTFEAVPPPPRGSALPPPRRKTNYNAGRRSEGGTSSGGVFTTPRRSVLMQAVMAESSGITIDGPLKILQVVDTNDDVISCQFTEDCTMLAAGFSSGFVRLYNPITRNSVYSLADEEVMETEVPVTCIKHKPYHRADAANRITATYVNGMIINWEYTTGNCIFKIRENRQVYCMQYHIRLPKFATVGEDGKIYMYDEETQKIEGIFETSFANDVMDGHMSRSYALAFHPRNDNEFISGGWDDTVQFWDTRKQQAVRHIHGVHICGEGLDISKNGKEILTCAYQQTTPLQLWEYGSGKLICNIQADLFMSKLYCGRWVTREHIVTGGTDANIIRIFDRTNLNTIALIQGLPGGVYNFDTTHAHHEKRSTEMSEGKEKIPKILFCSGRKLFYVEPRF